MNTKIIATVGVFLLSLSIMTRQGIFEMMPALIFAVAISSMIYITWDAFRV